MVSFSFGKKRKTGSRRPGARKGYSQQDFLKGTGNFAHYSGNDYSKPEDESPAEVQLKEKMDFGRRRRRYMGFGATSSNPIRTVMGVAGGLNQGPSMGVTTSLMSGSLGAQQTFIKDFGVAGRMTCPTGKIPSISKINYGCNIGRRRRRRYMGFGNTQNMLPLLQQYISSSSALFKPLGKNEMLFTFFFQWYIIKNTTYI